MEPAPSDRQWYCTLRDFRIGFNIKPWWLLLGSCLSHNVSNMSNMALIFMVYMMVSVGQEEDERQYQPVCPILSLDIIVFEIQKMNTLMLFVACLNQL